VPKSKQEAEEIINKQTNAFLTMAEAERDMIQVFAKAIGVSSLVADKWKAIQAFSGFLRTSAYCQQNGVD